MIFYDRDLKIGVRIQKNRFIGGRPQKIHTGYGQSMSTDKFGYRWTLVDIGGHWWTNSKYPYSV